MTPMPRPSLYGAARPRPFPPRFMTAGSRSAAPTSSDPGSPTTRALLINTPWNPVGTVLTPGRAGGHHGVCPRPLARRAQRRDLRVAGLRRPPPRLAGLGLGRRPRADGPDQQSVEDLCDDRMARRLLRRARGDHPGHVAGLAAVEPGASHVRAGCRRLCPDRRSGVRAPDDRRVPGSGAIASSSVCGAFPESSRWRARAACS